MVDVVNCLDSHTTVTPSSVERDVLSDSFRAFFSGTSDELAFSEVHEEGERTADEKEGPSIEAKCEVRIERRIERIRDGSGLVRENVGGDAGTERVSDDRDFASKVGIPLAEEAVNSICLSLEQLKHKILSISSTRC
jgi:hypothetical protein